jgi:hypothetical protein
MREQRSPRRALLAGGIAALALVLGGCVVAPAQPYYDGYGEVVTAPPPAPMVESYGPPPVVGSVWISGFWRWGGGRYAWVPGYWHAPRPGYYWQPHRWAPAGPGWRMAPGYWRRG